MVGTTKAPPSTWLDGALRKRTDTACLGSLGSYPQQPRDASHGPVPWRRMSHAPASAFHFAEKIQRKRYGVALNVDGMNCMRPDDPDGLRASGSSPLSHRAILSRSRNDTRQCSAARRIHGTGPVREH